MEQQQNRRWSTELKFKRRGRKIDTVTEIKDTENNSAMEKKTENDGSNLTLVASCEWVWKEKTASRLVQRWQLRAKHCAPTLHSAKVTVKSSSQTLMEKKKTALGLMP